MVQFFRSGQSDDRRRRVLGDDTGAGAAAATAAGKPSSRRAASRNYPVEALREHQPRLIDYVPQRLTTLLALFLVGIATIAGLEAAYATRALDVSEAHLPAFDLGEEGSLSNWFTSVTLALAGVVALVVYSLRRHRLDDYHGRYRIWLWAALCWMWLSIDEAACVHESFQAVLAALAGQSAPETELVWTGVYALVIGGVTLRLLFEMRSCRSSTLAIVLAAATFVGGIVAHLGWLPAAANDYRVLIEEGCEMAGSLLLLFSMCLHARFVVLDAQGMVAARPAKAAAAAPATTTRRGLWGRKTKIDPAHESVRPASKRSDLDSVSARDEDDDSSDDESDDDDQGDRAHDVHRLSKSERKALRRQQERQRKTRLG